MAARSNITDQELFKKYYISYKPCPDDSRKFTVNIFVVNDNYPSGQIVGMVEMCRGKWKISGDNSKEYRDLLDAVKDCVNIYQQCLEEYMGLDQNFLSMDHK